MARGSSPPHKAGRRRSRVPLLLVLLVLSLLSMFFVPHAIDYLGSLLGYYPDSAKGYICAVCGRLKYVGKRGSRLTAVSFGDSLATGYSERFVGPHSHIWVADWEHSRTFSGRQVGDSFAHMEIPIVAFGVPRALGMLEGTDYAEPVVRALCDLDNYFAYVARDTLVRRSAEVFGRVQPPTREELGTWWELNKQFFLIEHDPGRALPLLRTIERGEGLYAPLQDAARQTLDYHDRYGVPTLGAVVSHGLQDKNVY